MQDPASSSSPDSYNYNIIRVRYSNPKLNLGLK